MENEKIDTLVIGAGQAGVAMCEHRHPWRLHTARQ